MFDEISTHVLNDSAPQLVVLILTAAPLSNAPAVCALQAWKQSQLSSGVRHE